MGNCFDKRLDINYDFEYLNELSPHPTYVDDLSDKIVNYFDLLGKSNIKRFFDQSRKYFLENFKKDQFLILDEKLKLFQNKVVIWNKQNFCDEENIKKNVKNFDYNLEMEIPFTGELMCLFIMNLNNEKMKSFDKSVKEYHILEKSIENNQICIIEKIRMCVMGEEVERLDMRIIKKISKIEFEEITLSLELTELKNSAIFENDLNNDRKLFKVNLGGQKIFMNKNKVFEINKFVQYELQTEHDNEKINLYLKNKKLYFYKNLMIEIAEFIINFQIKDIIWFTHDKKEIERILLENKIHLKLMDFNHKKLSRVSQEILTNFNITNGEEENSEKNKES